MSERKLQSLTREIIIQQKIIHNQQEHIEKLMENLPSLR